MSGSDLQVVIKVINFSRESLILARKCMLSMAKVYSEKSIRKTKAGNL